MTWTAYEQTETGARILGEVAGPALVAMQLAHEQWPDAECLAITRDATTIPTVEQRRLLVSPWLKAEEHRRRVKRRSAAEVAAYREHRRRFVETSEKWG
jgi:hypothetical protein